MARRLASRRLVSRVLRTVTRPADTLDRATPLPPDATPPVISGVAVSPSGDSLTVTWTTNEPADTQLAYGTDDNLGTLTTLDPTLETTHSVTVTGLTPGTTYYYSALSRDARGNLSTSAVDSAETLDPDTVAPTFSSLTEVVTDTTVSLHSRTSELAKVWIEYGTSHAYGTLSTVEADFTLVRDSEISGLAPSTQYHYRYHAIDQSGNEGVTADRHWTTLAAPDVTAPVLSGISAVSTNPTSATVAWTTDEASDSQVEYGLTTDYGSETTLQTTLATGHSVGIGGLTAGTLYHYRVKSRDAAGNLATSADQTFTTAEAAPSAWSDTDPPSGATTSAITVNVTEASIGYDVVFTEGATTLSVVTAEFRLAGGTNRRDALDGWIVRPTSGSKNIYGSLLDLAPGTSYQVRLRLFWSDGTSSYRVGSGTTRTISNADASTLVANRFVDPVNGNDANNGTSAATAWKTYARVAAAYPTGGQARVQIVTNGNKVYLSAAGQTLNRGAITLFSDAPVVTDLAVDATGPTGPTVELSSGGRATIEPAAAAAPTGTVTADSWVTVGPWESVSLTGPALHGNPADTQYQVWKWASCPVADPAQGSWAASRDTFPPTALARWSRDNDITTPEAFAEFVHTSISYRYGFWSDGAGTVYLRLPGDVNPNTRWVWFGATSGVVFASGGSRITGIALHTFGSTTTLAAVDATTSVTVDHCAIANSLNGIRFNGSGAANGLVERNLLASAGLADITQTAGDWNDEIVNWSFVKSGIYGADDTPGVSPVAASRAVANEITAVRITSGARLAIVRRNTITGYFNGVYLPGAGSNTTSRANSWNCDLHHNYFEGIADDPFEPENTVINLRVWANTVRKSLTFASIAPLHFGPTYWWRNTAWELGSLVVGRYVDGSVGPAGKGFKMASNNAPQARHYVVHNTFDIDQTDPNGVMAFGISNTGSTFRPALWLKNNIITATSYLVDSVTINQFTDDFNFWSTTDLNRGIRVGVATIATTPTDYDNTGAGTTFADYRTATGQGANSNLVQQVTKEVNAADWLADVRAMWTSRATGDLRLIDGAAAINRGVVVPNISDLPGVNYQGAAPDLGALEWAWADLKATALDSGTTPWGFDATGLSASASLTRDTTAPTYDGTSYLACAITGGDSGAAFARGQFTIALGEGDIFRSRCAIYLPAGWSTAVVGSAQTMRHDPFPTLNSHSGLLYDQTANNWRLFLKDNGVDSDLTERFTISEGAWHLLEVQTLLSTTSGWVRVYLDGVLVASGSDLKTLYAADPNVTRFRYGLVAIGDASQGALSLNIDAVDLDVAAT